MATAAKAGDASQDFLGMSDEEFLKINSPDENAPQGSQEETSGSSRAEAPQAEKEQSQNEQTDEAASDSDAGDSGAAAGADGAGDPAKDESGADKAEAKAKAKPDEKVVPASGSKTDQSEAPGDEKGSSTEAEAAKPVDYEAFFKQVMTPFKANNKTIELKTPEEAIRLMQMGAGYARKIQDLQPHLKVLRLLEKNELLDQDKLSFLIDLNQKNPEAIKKIIKDAGIDPLDLNTEDNVTYSPNNHAVSDAEVAFHQALGDIQNHPQGQETLRIINQTWDQQSKSLLWDQPELLGIIQTQRDLGVYDQIIDEIDRQRMFGQIAPSTPFLQAYKAAGDHLTATNGFKLPDGQAPQIQTQTGSQSQQPQVIATRAAAPKATVQNGDKAAAASPTKSMPSRKPGATVNPLAMADDDFLKQFEGRL